MKTVYRFLIGCTLALLASLAAADSIGQLKAGIPENLPEVHLEDGKLVSAHPSVRLLHCIEKKLSYDLRWDAYPAARLIHLLQSGSVDFAFPLSISSLRDEIFGEFIYLGRNSDLLVHINPQLPGEKEGIVVGVVRGSIQALIAAERGYQLMKVNEVEVLIRLLLAKRVDAIIITEQYFKANTQSWAMPIYSTSFRSEQFGVYFSKSVAKGVVEAFASATRFCEDMAQ